MQWGIVVWKEQYEVIEEGGGVCWAGVVLFLGVTIVVRSSVVCCVCGRGRGRGRNRSHGCCVVVVVVEMVNEAKEAKE